MAYSKEFYYGLKGNNLKREGFRNYYVPELINIFKECNKELKSVVDIGCGTGTLLNEFIQKGIDDVYGVDFHDNKNLLEIPNSHYICQNLNDINELEMNRSFDLAVCLEVVEHLESEVAGSLVAFLCKRADVVLFSAAIPFQGGDGHINEQWPEYWENEFKKSGYVRIDYFRRKSWDKYDLIGYYRQNIFFYVRKECLGDYAVLQDYYVNHNEDMPTHVVHPTVYSYSVKNVLRSFYPEKYPRSELKMENLKNAKLLPDRVELLRKIPKGGIFIEIGVACGDFSKLIYEICEPSRLYCIDIWWNDVSYKATRDNLKEGIEKGIVKLMKGDSLDSLNEIFSILGGKSVDFVYIDAMHDYIHPKNELNICKDLVKDEGFIAGHDYVVLNVFEDPILQYGVVNAVNEFCVNENYEIVYMSMESLYTNPSYCLRKIRKG